MIKSHASLQVGNFVSIISNAEIEEPNPLVVHEIRDGMVFLDSIPVALPQHSIHFLKVSEMLLHHLKFEQVESHGLALMKRLEYVLVIEGLFHKTIVTIIFDKGLLPNAMLLVDGVIITRGKNWIHELQNAYFEIYTTKMPI